jgi:hypothetical protein
MKAKLIESGTRFGRLIVLKFAGTNKHGGYTYECKCDCGTLITTSRQCLIRGDTKSCGCLKKESDTVGKYSAPGEASINYLFDRYQRGAKIRGLNFELTKEQFVNLILSNCIYCGNPPSPFNCYVTGQSNELRNIRMNRSRDTVFRAWINVNSIDRMNNALGYILTNCAPSCKDCNEMKMDRNITQFLDHVSKIVKFQNYEQN